MAAVTLNEAGANSGILVERVRRLGKRALNAVPLMLPHVPSGLPNGYEIRWRVVNTGEEAVRARQLRGTFYHSYDRIYRDEPTKYTGVHWVEAFIVNMRNRTCVGRSERFFVVIQ